MYSRQRAAHECAVACPALLRAGVMLIDRNDELAVLHEKAHLQEAQVAAGNLDMGLRDNEVRRLQPAHGIEAGSEIVWAVHGHAFWWYT
jgi:hypothetical protein